MSSRAGSCAPSGVRRGALTRPPPRHTAPAEVWAPPGTLPNPGLRGVAAPENEQSRRANSEASELGSNARCLPEQLFHGSDDRCTSDPAIESGQVRARLDAIALAVG